MKLIHIQLLFFITSYVLFSGCKQKSPNEIHIDGHSHHIKIHYDTLCIMKENLTIVGGSPSDFSILNDSSYLLSIGKDLLLYNKQGEQTKIVGNYGEGPGEYLSPDRLFVSSKFIPLSSFSKHKAYNLFTFSNSSILSFVNSIVLLK